MKYFNTKDTAKLLGYNDDSYVRKLIADGKIRGEKHGRGWVVSPEEIQRYRVVNIIATKHKSLLAFNHELQLLVSNWAISNPKIESGPKDGIASFALTKGYKSHGAIIQLCKSGYGEDAGVIVRSLFELLITLLYILNDPTEKRAYRYLAYDWIIRKKMYDQTINSNPEILDQFNERRKNPKKWDLSFEDIEKNASKMQEKYKYKGNTWSDKSLFEMAREVGRERVYNTVYRLHSQNIHSQARSMNSYASRTIDGVIYLLAESENWVEEDLVAGFDFLYSLAVSVSKHFEWGIDHKLDEIAEHYWKTVSEINMEASK